MKLGPLLVVSLQKSSAKVNGQSRDIFIFRSAPRHLSPFGFVPSMFPTKHFRDYQAAHKLRVGEAEYPFGDKWRTAQFLAF